MFRTLNDLNPEQRVLIRLDLNSPVEDGEVQDNQQFNRYAKIVRELTKTDHHVVPTVHQGHPDGDDFVSLEQHADIPASHIDRKVGFVADTYDDNAIAAIDALEVSDVLLLENMRMCDEELPEEDSEIKADTEFVRTLTEHVDTYVNDVYSAAHRSHVSPVSLPLVLPTYMGRVMQAEYRANSSIATREFDGQVTVVVDGMKTTDVIDVVGNLGDKIDQFFLGGIAGELFLRITGDDVDFDLEGMDFFDSQQETNRETTESLLDEHGSQIKPVVDLIYEDEADDCGGIAIANTTEKDRTYLDVGSMTVDEYGSIVRDSEAVFMRGALDLPEDERFAVDTTDILHAITETDRFSVISGDNTFRTIGTYGMDEADPGHVPITGDAYARAPIGAPLAGAEAPRQD